MDPNGFPMALGKFPAVLAEDPVETLVDLQNGEMSRAIDTVASKHLLPQSAAQLAPWFTKELGMMKQVGNKWDRYQSDDGGTF